jgi:hypothetical protein
MATTMSKTEAKEKAQDMLMHHMKNACYELGDNNGMEYTQEEHDLIWEQMQNQVGRVYKLFGYDTSNPIIW